MLLATTHTRTHNIYIYGCIVLTEVIIMSLGHNIYIYGCIVLTEVIIMSLGQWMGLMQACTYSRIRLVAC